MKFSLEDLIQYWPSPERVGSESGSCAPHDSSITSFAVNPSLAHPLVLPDVLSGAECAKVIELGETSAPISAHATGDETRSTAARVGRITWIRPEHSTQWLFERVATLFATANQRYGLDLAGMIDPIQFSIYRDGAYFDWHNDIGSDLSAGRKLSVTIQLVNSDEYDGGALEFHHGSEMPIARTRGTATVFPSYLAHRVTPVRRGRRISIVAWAYGPAFR